MKLPSDLRKRFQRYGQTGGRARAARLTARERRAIARRGALRRWTRERFGDASFAALGLPGGEILDAGLQALAAEQETPEALLVSLAAPRLRREGVPLPSPLLPDPEMRLYRLLEEASGDLAHARYLAYLAQAASFADACALLRRRRSRRAR
jgi:hypothetical protein